MKLKDIFLGSALFLSSWGFSQEPITLDIYTKGEGRFSPRLNNSSLKVNQNEVSFSFLFGLYSMKFQKLNDSTYREIIDNNLLWYSKEETFEYSFKDFHYVFESYSVEGGEPRKEKEKLEGNLFDKKYKTLPELFNEFERGEIGDSLHFIILGLPYSVKVEKKQKGKEVVYSSSLKDIVKVEPDDDIIFPYPIKVFGVKENGKIKPLGFDTYFLRANSGKKTHLEGILRED